MVVWGMLKMFFAQSSQPDKRGSDRKMEPAKRYHLVTDLTRQNAAQAIFDAPDGWIVQIGEEKRTEAQNALLWPILKCFAKQKTWRVNGKAEKLTPEEWKDILTASFFREVRLADSIGGGGLVMLGARTSKMGKKTFSDFIEFIHASASDLGVIL